MAYIILILGCIPFIFYVIKYGFSHLVVEDYSLIHPNAKIIGISHERDDWGKYRHIKTIVRFTDGVEYHTYKCRSEIGFGCTKYVVDGEVVKKITNKAIIAHDKLAAKQSKKFRENSSSFSAKALLPKEILNEFSDYPEEFLNVVCSWINQWQSAHLSSSRYTTYDYLKALASCGNGRKSENGLQICQNIYEEKMLFRSSDINHMMKQLNEVLMCEDISRRIVLEDHVINGLQGFQFAELIRTGKF